MPRVHGNLFTDRDTYLEFGGYSPPDDVDFEITAAQLGIFDYNAYAFQNEGADFNPDLALFITYNIVDEDGEESTQRIPYSLGRCQYNITCTPDCPDDADESDIAWPGDPKAYVAGHREEGYGLDLEALAEACEEAFAEAQGDIQVYYDILLERYGGPVMLGLGNRLGIDGNKEGSFFLQKAAEAMGNPHPVPADGNLEKAFVGVRGHLVALPFVPQVGKAKPSKKKKRLVSVFSEVYDSKGRATSTAKTTSTAKAKASTAKASGSKQTTATSNGYHDTLLALVYDLVPNGGDQASKNDLFKAVMASDIPQSDRVGAFKKDLPAVIESADDLAGDGEDGVVRMP